MDGKGTVTSHGGSATVRGLGDDCPVCKARKIEDDRREVLVDLPMCLAGVGGMEGTRSTNECYRVVFGRSSVLGVGHSNGRRGINTK